MNESNLRHTLLLRAFETRAPDDLWPERDRLGVTQIALEQIGETSEQQSLSEPERAEQFVAARARAACPELFKRDPNSASAFKTLTWRPWITPAICLLAAVLGVASDALSNARQINLLAPPLIGVLIWNLGLYALLAIQSIAMPSRLAREQSGPIARLVTRLGQGNARTGSQLGPASHFATHWMAAVRPLLSLRATRTMHLAALALAAGAVLSMYVRGLAFEFTAGWESTFLDAAQVKDLLHTVLAPASFLTGIALPDTETIKALAFSAGPGENAASWIHLWATTIALFVLLPRLALGSLSALRAHRLADNLPYDFSEPYFDSLARTFRGDPATLVVIPYGSKMSEQAVNSLQNTFRRFYGVRSQVTLRPTVPFGDEDDFAVNEADQNASTVAILFSLSATPELENQGQFVLNTAGQLPTTTRLMVMIDEAAFIKRFPDNLDRLQQRQAAWRKTISVTGHPLAFIRFEPAQTEFNLDALRAAHPGPGKTSQPTRSPDLESR